MVMIMVILFKFEEDGGKVSWCRFEFDSKGAAGKREREKRNE